MPRSIRISSCLALAVAGLAVACSAPDRPRQAAPSDPPAAAIPAEVEVLLREGTAAYRRGDYQAALEAYGRATDRAPGLDAGWFGIHLAEKALGNDQAAADALERMQLVPPGAAAHTAPVDPEAGTPDPHAPNPLDPGSADPDPRAPGPRASP